jgi:hypothetical protein
MNITKNITTVPLARSLLAALVAGATLVVSPAARAVVTTTYTEQINVNATALTLQSGDTVTVTTGRGIYLSNGGSLAINPSDGAIFVSSSDTTSIYTGAAVYATGGGGNVNLGSGSILESFGDTLLASGSGTMISGDHLTVTTGSESTSALATAVAVVAGTTGSINLVTGSHVKVYTDGSAQATGIGAWNGGTVNATDGLTIDVISKASSRDVHKDVRAVLVATATSAVNLGTNATIHSLNARGLLSGDGATLDLGSGSLVEAGVFALGVYTDGKINVTGSTLAGVGADSVGVRNVGGTITITGSDVSAGKHAVEVADSADSSTEGANPGNTITISGSSLHSATGALIGVSPDGRTDGVSFDIVLKDGSRASSDTGILYEVSSSAVDRETSISISIEGAGTRAEGIFAGSSIINETLSVSAGATWASTGSSMADNLAFDNANVLLTLDSLTDTITANNTLTLAGTTTLTVGLTNNALQEIIAGSSGTFELDATALITGSTVENDDNTGNFAYTMLDRNDAGSTWTVTNLDNGHFRISVITLFVVPEPAAWAALAGLVILAWAALRRSRT